MKKVYLSGGTVSGWQDDVIHYVPNATMYNPRQFEMPGVKYLPSKMYSSMDRYAIDECDIVFGYLEADNPTPINTVAELCYGKGLGKITIFCDEWHRDNLANLRTLKPNGDWYKPHYLDMVREWVDFYDTDFGRAMELLKWLNEQT